MECRVKAGRSLACRVVYHLHSGVDNARLLGCDAIDMVVWSMESEQILVSESVDLEPIRPVNHNVNIITAPLHSYTS